MSEHTAPIRLGFTRGVAPSKWADRWGRAVPERALELVPISQQFGRSGSEEARSCDMLIERAVPGERPLTHTPDGVRTHHAMLLYEEAIALVLPKDHELAKEAAIHIDDLSLVKLLDYPGHAPEWPAAEPWVDQSWEPRGLAAALELVATGLGGILVPLPLAQHVANKREHAILRVVGDSPESSPLRGSTVWATWAAEHNSEDLQQLAGIMRGRTARSSRRAQEKPESPSAKKPQSQQQTQQQAQQQAKKKKPALKPNSRGAQLAAVREKAARNKAIRAAAKRKKR